MKAIAFSESLPSDHPDALFDCVLDKPEPTGLDLLVEVRAISVNPVDCKIRSIAPPPKGEKKVLGWDAAGVVKAIGEQVSNFKVGDEVYYAGDLTRPGSNAEYQLVDERIVGKKPTSLSNADAASLPLTAITAWELLFDRLAFPKDSDDAILLVTGAAGGVGSIMIQLVKTLTKGKVIATASRPESQQWVAKLGADYVLDHSGDMVKQLRAQGIDQVTHVASLTHTDNHYESLIELLEPQGKFGLIDDPNELDIKAFKRKSISLHWEFMYTRSMFTTTDIQAQGELLNTLSELVDQGKIVPTLGANLGQICAANLRRAHQMIETRKTIGKLVLEGFTD